MKTPRFALPGPLGLGCAPLGDLFARMDEATVSATIAAAWEAGLRFFDVAPLYGYGLAEHRLGTALRRYPRDEYVISTKVGRLLTPRAEGPNVVPPFQNGLAFNQHWDFSGPGVRRSIEDSLQRLGLGRIDVVLVHDLAPDHHPEDYEECFRIARFGAFPELIRLRDEGTIRAWGLGTNVVEPCLRMLEETDPDVFLLAGRYTLLDHEGLNDLFPACFARGVRVVIGGPFNSGLLAGGRTFDYADARPERLAARDQFLAVCRDHDVSLKAAALQFCAAHPVVASVIAGMRTPQEVKENAASIKRPIPGAFWTDLKARGLVPSSAPTPPGP